MSQLFVVKNYLSCLQDQLLKNSNKQTSSLSINPYNKELTCPHRTVYTRYFNNNNNDVLVYQVLHILIKIILDSEHQQYTFNMLTCGGTYILVTSSAITWISRQVKEIIRITSRSVVAQSLLMEFDWSISGLTNSSCTKCSIDSGFEFSGDISSCLKHEIFHFYKPNQIKLTKNQWKTTLLSN